MRLILIFTLISIKYSAIGQKTIYGKVLSVADRNPVSNFFLKTDKNQLIRTDSTGAFSFSTTINKIKLSFPYTLTKSKDTTLFLSDTITTVLLLTYLTWDSSQAKYDIEHNDIKLFCCFGFNVLAPTQMDKEFEKEFGVKYYIIGDAPPASIDKLQTYNIAIGKYLDGVYGTEWRKRTKAHL